MLWVLVETASTFRGNITGDRGTCTMSAIPINAHLNKLRVARLESPAGGYSVARRLTILPLFPLTDSADRKGPDAYLLGITNNLQISMSQG